MNTRVLVVGGAGYIGGVLTDILQQRGKTVRVYDALWYEPEYRKPIDFIRGDVRDADRLLPHLAWADAVIWLAAVVGDGGCDAQPAVAQAINHDAVAWLATHYGGRIVFPSTSMVYGVAGQVIDETAPLQPQSLYARTKAAAERQLSVVPPAIIFRLGTLFGLGDVWSRPRFDLVIHRFVRQAIHRQPITVYGGQQIRAIAHVRDVATMLANAVDHSIQGIFNLHAANISIAEIAQRIQAHFPDAPVTITPPTEPVTASYQLSSDRARQQLQFLPQLTLDDGIREMGQLITSGQLRDPFSERYSNEEYIRQQPHRFLFP